MNLSCSVLCGKALSCIILPGGCIYPMKIFEGKRLFHPSASVQFLASSKHSCDVTCRDCQAEPFGFSYLSPHLMAHPLPNNVGRAEIVKYVREPGCLLEATPLKW